MSPASKAGPSWDTRHSSDGMRISEIAAVLGTTPRAIRYYEKEGLIAADRTSGGARRYGPVARRRLEHIVMLRRLDLPLSRIRTALEAPDSVLRQELQDRLVELDRKRAFVLDMLGRFEEFLAA